MTPLDPIYLLAALATWPFWRRKARGDWPARFGKGPVLPSLTRPRLLIHAVSVGEVSALRTLVPLLSVDTDLVISVGTDTGIERARDLYSESATIVRYPLDFSWCVRRFLDRVRPDAVALVELELWPNFLKSCRTRNIPVAVINGRLSERSLRGYRKLRPFLRRCFGSLQAVGVQDEAYRERFIKMGTPADRCVVVGSMKWDAPPMQRDSSHVDRLAREMGIDRDRPLIVAASTAETEEAMLHGACPPDVQLLCAPRRPERFDEAGDALGECVRRSRPGQGSPSSDRFLLDTIGELGDAYALADIVVLGRSFGTLHGSDPLEPAALGKPILIGPATSDFAHAVQALSQCDAIVRTTRDGLAGDLQRLLASSEERSRLARQARACVLANQGPSERYARMLRQLLGRADGNHTGDDGEDGT